MCVEALDGEFIRTFWEFVRQGGYQHQQRSTSKRIFYRFQKPTESDYPVMLELFSRSPDSIVLGDDSHLTPIPVDEDVSSLSAILLNNDYYEFLHGQKRTLAGVSIVSDYGLIPLKAKAWLDLTERKAKGEAVDSRDIKKHRGDVLRLYQILDPEMEVALPVSVRQDLAWFLDGIAPEIDSSILKNLGIQGVTGNEVVANLKRIYGIIDG